MTRNDLILKADSAFGLTRIDRRRPDGFAGARDGHPIVAAKRCRCTPRVRRVGAHVALISHRGVRSAQPPAATQLVASSLPQLARFRSRLWASRWDWVSPYGPRSTTMTRLRKFTRNGSRSRRPARVRRADRAAEHRRRRVATNRCGKRGASTVWPPAGGRWR